MKLQDFDYQLPKELIAQYPAENRSDSRLLVVDRKNKSINHHFFSDLIEFVNKGDALVVNDTKVRPARLIGRRSSGGKVDILLLERLDKNIYSVLLKPLSRIKFGEKILLGASSLSLKLLEKNNGKVIVKFDSKIDVESRLKKIGLMPLPPYIKRAPEKSDSVRYQTVYAKKDGAIAAPTAGLHFTKRIISQIKKKGAGLEYVTLHVGQGTFAPVKSEDISKHKLHKESFEASHDALDRIMRVKQDGGRIFAVGTTAARVLESVNFGLRTDDKIISGESDLFIYPPYEFKIADCLLTNFHLPRTTLFMLVCAFAGRGLMMQAYEQAIKEKYRFYSYGDAMLIV